MLQKGFIEVVFGILFQPLPSAQTWKADNGNGTFTNTLFYEEFSDPDMIRVGNDFYLTGTTMHSMPGLPILHSRDLVNWSFLAYASDRLDLGPAYRLEDGEQIVVRASGLQVFATTTGPSTSSATLMDVRRRYFALPAPRAPGHGAR